MAESKSIQGRIEALEKEAAELDKQMAGLLQAEQHIRERQSQVRGAYAVLREILADQQKDAKDFVGQGGKPTVVEGKPGDGKKG